MKIYLIILSTIFLAFISLINSQENDDYFHIEILFTIFNKTYGECSESLMKSMQYDKIKQSLTKYPYIVDNIGKSLNDLGDEIECLNAFTETNYVIATIKNNSFNNDDDMKLINFFNITNFCVGACLLRNCSDSFKNILGKLMNISDIEICEDSEKDQENNYLINLIISIFVYLLVKLIVGIIRLICFPKGYDKYAVKLLKDKGIAANFKSNNNENSDNDFNREKLISFNDDSNISEYDPNYDFSSSFPFYLRIMRFFDLFNDIHYFFSRRNRYFNDNGLESLNFMKAIILYLIIFTNTFNSLMVLPSKDILNKSFLKSNSIIFYLLFNASLNYWIFLEAAYTSYKLLIFIKTQMYLYYKNKNFYFNLLVIYGKFILLFIPKVATFILCYYFFYFDVQKFKSLFQAKTTFKYITEKVIYNNNITTCHQNYNNIFTSLLIFSNNINKFKSCFDFTFINFNIFLCSFCSMILLYFAFIIRRKIFEIFLIIVNLVLFIGLMFIVDDPYIPKNKTIDFTFYHLKGQEYTIKIFHLSLLVYNLGFIFGILYFNYNNNKNLFTKKNKNLKKINEKNKSLQKGNNDKINEFNLNYYPLSFLNTLLKFIHNLNFGIKTIIILICSIVMFIPSYVFRTYIKEKINEGFKLEKTSKFYFLFGKHIFIIFFFIINLILITLPKKGLYKTLVKLRLNNALSKTGFTIICLYQILAYFSFTGFLVKIKFNLSTFILISIGNFLIVFNFCLFLNIIFELPIRMIIKKIIRFKKSKN